MKSLKVRKTIALLAIFAMTSIVSIGIIPQACKASPPTSDYSLVFEDNFDGTSLDTNKWNYRLDSKAWSTQRSENVTVGGGLLKIALKKETVRGKDYTAGGVISKQEFKYGYYEIRAKLFRAKGWHQSFWTMGYYQEIDGFEVDSISPAQFKYTLHRYNPRVLNINPTSYTGSDSSADFHVYGFEWTSSQVKWYIDGLLIATKDFAGPHSPQNMWLTVIASSMGGTDSVDDSALPGEVQFDYFRFYARNSDNLALNKTVTVDSTYSGSYPGLKAVDGDKSSDTSRWLSADNTNTHSIEVDLGTKANINSVRFWTGYQGYNYAISNYKIQSWDGSAWVDNATKTGNTSSEVFVNFATVRTDKIRMYSDPGNFTKMYELEVHGNTVSPTPTPGPTPASTVIVDNGDAAYSETGNWSNSTLTGYNSSSTRYCNTLDSTAIWTPNITEAGDYKVYVWYPYNSNSASHADYTIKYNDNQEETVFVDQSFDAGGWRYLGTYDFAESGTTNKVILNVNSNGYYRADAVKFESTWATGASPTPAPRYIDKPRSGYTETGTWNDSGLIGYNWSYTRYSATANSTAVWTPSINRTEYYNVYVWYPYNAGNTTNAKYTITYDGGSSDVYVNQTQNADQWYKLGTYKFASGTTGKIILTVASGIHRADAVRFEPCPIVDNGGAGYAETGTWNGSSLTGFNSSSTRYCSTTGNTATWTPTISTAGNYKVYVWYPYNSNSTTNAKYTVMYNGGSSDVYVNQTQDANQWKLLGTYNFAAGTSGNVKITVNDTNPHRADAVKFEPDF